LETYLAIAGVDGDGLFHPSDWGIVPNMIDTSSWRGFGCRYRIDSGNLQLEAVGVGLRDEQQTEAAQGIGPILFGRVPEWNQAAHKWLYDDLHQPMPFEGRMLVASNWLGPTGIGGGWPDIYEFESVLELVFEKGTLVRERDCAPAMRLIRRCLGFSVPPLDRDTARAKIDTIMGNWLDTDFRQRLDHYSR
jgi:hypothetical protein